MIWRVTERSAFDTLRRKGSRLRQGPLSLTYLLEADGLPPRVAFAVGRRVGPAVVRNRLRRRTREAIRGRLASGRSVPAGWYLIGFAPETASLSYDELRDLVEHILDRVEQRADR